MSDETTAIDAIDEYPDPLDISAEDPLASIKGEDDPFPVGHGTVSADDTGDLEETDEHENAEDAETSEADSDEDEGEKAREPYIPKSRYDEVRSEADFYKSLLLQSQQAQTQVAQEQTAQEPEDPITGLLTQIKGLEAVSPLEELLAQTVAAMYDQNKAMQSRFETVQTYTQTAQQAAQAAQVETIIGTVSAKYGLGDLDEQAKFDMAEEALNYYEGARARGKNLTEAQAFELVARTKRAEMLDAQAKQSAKSATNAKRAQSGSRPNGVNGPVNSQSPASLTREQKWDRILRQAGGANLLQ